jgi:hypothetical protein
MPGVYWYIYASASTSPGQSLGIYGYGNIQWVSILDASPGYNGNITIECDTLTFQNYAFLSAITSDTVLRTFRIRAKKLIQNGVTGMLIVSPWVLDIDVYRYEGSVYGPGGPGVADFWMNNDLSAGVQCVSKIKIVDAVVNHALVSFWGDASFMNFSLGGTNNKMFVEIDNLKIDNVPFNTGGPFMIRMGLCNWNVDFKANKAVLNNCNVVFDQAFTDAKVLLQGKYYVTIAGSGTNQFIPFWIAALTLESKADVIASVGDNPVYEIVGGQVDIRDCKIINGTTAGTEVGIRKSGGVLRLDNVKILASSSLFSVAPGEPVELYSCYTNIAPINITNTLAPDTAFVINASMTDNNF